MVVHPIWVLEAWVIVEQVGAADDCASVGRVAVPERVGEVGAARRHVEAHGMAIEYGVGEAGRVVHDCASGRVAGKGVVQQ